MARDIHAIMLDDRKRRNAREATELLELYARVNAQTANTVDHPNPNAPAWRNPELHLSTHLEPTHQKRSYKRVAAQHNNRHVRRVPAFAGSLEYARANQLHANAVKVTRPDGTTEIVPTSHYRRPKNSNASKRTTQTNTNSTAQTTTQITTRVDRTNEVANLAPIQDYSQDS